MTGTNLQWPPTPYGEMVYSIVMETTKMGKLKPKDAQELLEEWFKPDTEEDGAS